MVKLSIVIVAYKNFKSLTECLNSIPKKEWIEVVVVNNTFNNRGFGKGCNLGSSFATGEFVLFLNPDCIVDEVALEKMIQRIEKDATIGILGPQLLDTDSKPYLSCSRQPTRLTAPIVYSILNSWFHTSKLVKRFWYNHTPPKEQKSVGIVSGAAMLMRKEIFELLEGFDEKFFLYWEEVDLAKRVQALGYRVVFEPSTSIYHEQGTSTTTVSKAALAWFKESRFYFFSKHFGMLYGLVLEAWYTLSEEWRYTLSISILLMISAIYYTSGSWLKPELFELWQLPMLEQFPWLIWWYWGSVAGALGGMTIIYNELKLKNPLLHFLITILVGIVLLLLGPAGMLLSLLVSLLWTIFDNLPHTLRLRQALAFGLVLGMGFVIPNVVKRVQTVSTHNFYTDATKIVKLINVRPEQNSVDVECVQCKSQADLKVLEAFLTTHKIDLDTREYAQSPRKYFVQGPFIVHWELSDL